MLVYVQAKPKGTQSVHPLGSDSENDLAWGFLAGLEAAALKAGAKNVSKRPMLVWRTTLEQPIGPG